MCGFVEHKRTDYDDYCDVFEDISYAFIELTRGCWNTRCPFKCSAQKDKYQVSVKPEDLNRAVNFFGVHNVCSILFGSGETSEYPFKNISNESYFMGGMDLNIMPDYYHPEDFPGKFYEGLRSVTFCAYDVDDVLIANKLVKESKRCLTFFLKIPVLSGVEYLKMAEKSVGMEIIFHAVSEVDPRHISVNEFSYKFKSSFGFMPETEITPGIKYTIKPVVETIIGNDIVIRRCFDKKSKKIIVPLEDSKKSTKELLEFFKSSPPCKECVPNIKSWKYLLKR